ncbi:uncharacterized [Tachysurus ichikawai]
MEQISRFYESVTAGLLGTDLELSYDKHQDHSQVCINLQQLLVWDQLALAVHLIRDSTAPSDLRSEHVSAVWVGFYSVASDEPHAVSKTALPHSLVHYVGGGREGGKQGL